MDGESGILGLDGGIMGGGLGGAFTYIYNW